MATRIFLNLPVNDLNKSIEFFTHLGFTFNPTFTNEDGACMIIGENIFSMLLVERFFKTFTVKEISNSHKTTEAIIAISVESRGKVDEMVQKAFAAGGTSHREVKDHGWMYEHGFEDLDGHLWEVLYIDETQSPG